MESIGSFLKRKDIVISGKRYGIDALGAMAQGLFCSLLIGTIIKTLGEQTSLTFLVDIGNYAYGRLCRQHPGQHQLDPRPDRCRWPVGGAFHRHHLR